jgi:hypothetical protein
MDQSGVRTKIRILYMKACQFAALVQIFIRCALLGGRYIGVIHKKAAFAQWKHHICPSLRPLNILKCLHQKARRGRFKTKEKAWIKGWITRCWNFVSLPKWSL